LGAETVVSYTYAVEARSAATQSPFPWSPPINFGRDRSRRRRVRIGGHMASQAVEPTDGLANTNSALAEDPIVTPTLGIPTLFVCHGDDGGPRFHPCRRVQEALRAADIEYEKVIAGHPSARASRPGPDRGDVDRTRNGACGYGSPAARLGVRTHAAMAVPAYERDQRIPPLATWRPRSLVHVREWLARTVLGTGPVHLSGTFPAAT
jgi:hypothetical protein